MSDYLYLRLCDDEWLVPVGVCRLVLAVDVQTVVNHALRVIGR